MTSERTSADEGPGGREPESEAETALEAAPARRAPRISEALVFQAADELLLAGDRPTIDRVRMRLGRGSPNTINDHLDRWWKRLGSRLRDLPGQEFPQLPEAIALTLQKLWDQALDGARASLHEKIATQERALQERQVALDVRESAVHEQEQALLGRLQAQEESLALAREQLLAANSRAERLEMSLTAREGEAERQSRRGEALEREAAEERLRREAAVSAHQAERARADERHEATEARWLAEVDRGRQLMKSMAKDHDRDLKELRSQLGQVEAHRDDLKRDLKDARAEARAAKTLRAQAEKRLAALLLKAVKAARAEKAPTLARDARGRRRE